MVFPDEPIRRRFSNASLDGHAKRRSNLCRPKAVSDGSPGVHGQRISARCHAVPRSRITAERRTIARDRSAEGCGRVLGRRIGAPRSMKIGNTASPWRYDGGAYHAISHPRYREHLRFSATAHGRNFPTPITGGPSHSTCVQWRQRAVYSRKGVNSSCVKQRHGTVFVRYQQHYLGTPKNDGFSTSRN
jgi:hypothetical protein